MYGVGGTNVESLKKEKKVRGITPFYIWPRAGGVR